MVALIVCTVTDTHPVGLDVVPDAGELPPEGVAVGGGVRLRAVEPASGRACVLAPLHAQRARPPALQQAQQTRVWCLVLSPATRVFGSCSQGQDTSDGRGKGLLRFNKVLI